MDGGKKVPTAAAQLLPAVLALRLALRGAVASARDDGGAALAVPASRRFSAAALVRRLVRSAPVREALRESVRGIGLACLPGSDCSVLSTLLAGHDSIEVAYEHPLMRFFTMVEANELRLVHSEFAVAVAATRFNSGSSSEGGGGGGPWRSFFPKHAVRSTFASWHACFPAAESLWLGSAQAFNEALVCAVPTAPGEAGALAGAHKLDAHGLLVRAAGAHGLADALRWFGALTHLDLSGNAIGDVGIDALVPSLPLELMQLQLGHNNIGPAGAQSLAAALPAWGALTHLVLDNNHVIGDVGLAALAPALPRQLEQLQMAYCGIGPGGARALADVLPALGALTHLDLAGNLLGDAGVAALAPALPAQLRQLQLAYNAIETAGVQCLVGVLPGALTHLNLEGNELDDAGIIALAPTLPLHLQQLQLGCNNFGAAGIGALAGQLRVLHELTQLHLTHNPGLADADFATLATALPPQLEQLWLCGSDIGPLGVVALVGRLPVLRALMQLHLNDSPMDDAAATTLATALPLQLRQLQFSCDDIGTAGMIALAGRLPLLRDLTHLRLQYNPGLDDAGVAALTAAFPSLTNLRELDLTGHFIGDEGLLAIAEALPHMTALEWLGLHDDRQESDVFSFGAARTLGRALPLGCKCELADVSPPNWDDFEEEGEEEEEEEGEEEEEEEEEM